MQQQQPNMYNMPGGQAGGPNGYQQYNARGIPQNMGLQQPVFYLQQQSFMPQPNYQPRPTGFPMAMDGQFQRFAVPMEDASAAYAQRNSGRYGAAPQQQHGGAGQRTNPGVCITCSPGEWECAS